MRLINHSCIVRTKASAPCMHQMLKVAYRPKECTADRRKPSSPGPPSQDLGAWTLLGEYCGVWDRSEALDARTAEDPLGLGTLRQDRVVELGYTTSNARPGVEKGRCPSIAAASALEDGLLPCSRRSCEPLGCT